MARFRTRAILWLWAATAAAQTGVVLDRVAVSMGHQVIPLSAVRRALRMEALASGRPLEDTPANRRAAAARLIDQAILEREIELGNFTPPALSEADTRIASYLKERGLSRAELSAEITRLGFTEDDFRREIAWRLHVERFVDFRFASGAQASDEEIEKYYRADFLSKWKGPGAAPALDAVRADIEHILTTRKTDDAMEQWLERMRATLHPRLFDAALDQPEAQP
jgi:hypothetical protein